MKHSVEYRRRSGAGGGLIIDWGELADLRQMNEAAEASTRERSDTSRSQVTEIADRIGEVQWEGPFAGVGEASEGRQEVLFDLQPISSPLKLRFFVDVRRDRPVVGDASRHASAICRPVRHPGTA